MHILSSEKCKKNHWDVRNGEKKIKIKIYIHLTFPRETSTQIMIEIKWICDKENELEKSSKADIYNYFDSANKNYTFDCG